MRVSAFDLGTSGAVFRAKREGDGTLIPLSCEKWQWTGKTDEERYHGMLSIARVEVEWADAVGYEHVQFNRGKSLIEGFRGILIAQAEDIGRFCHGVNVATLKSYAINGRWSDADRKKRGKEPIPHKKKMQMALSSDHPHFFEMISRSTAKKTDDLVDAAWVAIWLLEHAEES